MSTRSWGLPGSLRKHYIRPLIRFITDRETYRRLYDPSEFFDQFHALGEDGVDADTIAPGYPITDATYHYNAVENGIIEYLKARKLTPPVVLDVGSGTGHWLDFYNRVFSPGAVHGADISRESVRKLEKRFQDRPAVHVHHTDLLSSDVWKDDTFTVINAIGVLFHIVSDDKWEQTLAWCFSKLERGGVLIVGGLFGPFTANVQFEPVRFSSTEGYEKPTSQLVCNKRVRSRWKWKRALKKCGFRDITIRHVRVPRFINSPENNLLFAVK